MQYNAWLKIENRKLKFDWILILLFVAFLRRTLTKCKQICINKSICNLRNDQMIENQFEI